MEKNAQVGDVYESGFAKLLPGLPLSGSLHVQSGFICESRGSLTTPPGLSCTLNVGFGGYVRFKRYKDHLQLSRRSDCLAHCSNLLPPRIPMRRTVGHSTRRAEDPRTIVQSSGIPLPPGGTPWRRPTYRREWITSFHRIIPRHLLI
jgi:hypothetical protein